MVDSAHGTEIARAGRRMRLEAVAERAAQEFAVDESVLVAEYGPEVLIPAAEEGPPVLYDRDDQERRAQTAQRLLDQLGRVNPLALEEFAALEERHAFLVTQLEDLKNTRRDLLTVIKEVDERVQQVFAAAYPDTAREFERIFGVLFPGGDGGLVLTDPDDMLTTGIDFEARPPGKKVKRLSLLSGGERALTAIAFLVAIFKARPSPFYVLDEVEAALDDANLQRLIGTCSRSCGRAPADHRHAPEADDGGRRLAVRRQHARGRRDRRGQPAAAGARERPEPSRRPGAGPTCQTRAVVEHLHHHHRYRGRAQRRRRLPAGSSRAAGPPPAVGPKPPAPAPPPRTLTIAPAPGAA